MKAVWWMLVIVGVATLTWATRRAWHGPTTWEGLARPGALSRAHAFLDDQCAACHSGVDGVRPSGCVPCHANDRALLERQPTAFHARIDGCADCHVEHLGRQANIVTMDHVALARIALRQGRPADDQRGWIRRELGGWRHVGRSARNLPPTATGDDPVTQLLGCVACHGNQDRHRRFFGDQCGDCHVTQRWAVAGYRHPPPTSHDCNECHLPPPSHNMEHFSMVSQKVARQEHARVDQCYACHQTTAWNDIRGVGYYKHH